MILVSLLIPWVSRGSSLGGGELWEGVLFLVMTILVLLFAITTFVIQFFVPRGLSEGFARGANAAGAGIGLMLLLYAVLWISIGAARFHQEYRSYFYRISFFDLLGAGFWMTLVVSPAVLGIYCASAAVRRQGPWLAIGLGAGALLGLLTGLLRTLVD